MRIGPIVFSGAVFVIGLVYEIMALKMPLGGISYPGPGYFPAVIGVFLMATSLGCLLQETLPRRKGGDAAAAPATGQAPPAPSGRNVGKTVQLTALMIGYILALKPLGFPIAICVFLGVAIRIFGYRRWLPTVAMAGAITAASYVSFVLWLKVPLPMGILEDLLG